MVRDRDMGGASIQGKQGKLAGALANSTDTDATHVDRRPVSLSRVCF